VLPEWLSRQALLEIWRRVIPKQRHMRAIYGVRSGYEPPKMSELPKVAGQSCGGAGVRADVLPAWSAARHASIAGQFATLRVSFHTAARYVRAATA
jgi:hypothetical protein